MAATAQTFVDPRGIIKTWLGTQTAVTAIATGGVYTRTPDSPPSGGPWVAIATVMDVPGPEDVPWTHAHVQFDCYATTLAVAASLAYALVSTVRLANSGALLSSALRFFSATVTRNQPDLIPGRRDLTRHSVDVMFDLIAV